MLRLRRVACGGSSAGHRAHCIIHTQTDAPPARSAALGPAAVANYPVDGFRNLSVDLNVDRAFRFVIDNAPSNFATAYVDVQTAQRNNGIALISRASSVQVRWASTPGAPTLDRFLE